MQRRTRGASSLRLARCLTPANLIRGDNAGVPERRIFGGCLLPTPEGSLARPWAPCGSAPTTRSRRF